MTSAIMHDNSSFVDSHDKGGDTVTISRIQQQIHRIILSHSY
jgi:hypothetical protein